MKKYLCEFAGTLALVLFGCGAAVLYGNPLSTALSFGFVLIAVVYAFGEVSGGHVNPAVSLAMFIDKRLSFKDLIGYVVAQVLGAICGSGLLAAIFKMSSLNEQGIKNIGLGANGYDTASLMGLTMLGALVFEIVITAFFVYVVLAVTKNKENKNAGLVIGLTLALVHILGYPATGTSVNPARSFAPAILLGETALSQVWLFIVAPLIGAIVAALAFKLVNLKKKTEEQKEEEYSEKINAKEQKHAQKITAKENKKAKETKETKPAKRGRKPKKAEK